MTMRRHGPARPAALVASLHGCFRSEHGHAAIVAVAQQQTLPAVPAGIILAYRVGHKHPETL